MPEFMLDTIHYVDALPVLVRASLLALAALVEYVLPIFPGDTLVIAAGFFISRGNMELLEIYIGLSIGATIGIWLTFFFGKLIAKRNIKLPTWSVKFISANEIAKINQWYKKYGYGLILVNRFFPGIRSLFFVAAGMSNMPFVPVLIIGIFSALLFNSMLLIVGYLAGQNIEIINNFWRQYTTITYSIIGVFIAIFLVIFFLKRNKSE